LRAATAQRKRTGLGMTPMIDMAFLLITFFVMTLRLTASQEEKVTLPRADQAQTTHESQLTIVTVIVDESGRIFSGGSERSLADVEAMLRQRLDAGKDVKVVLRADARSPFARVRRVMRVAAENGIEKLSISALKLADGQAADGSGS
jgi:biopolymer transport protein ExbD